MNMLGQHTRLNIVIKTTMIRILDKKTFSFFWGFFGGGYLFLFFWGIFLVSVVQILISVVGITKVGVAISYVAL